jgi:hypothetical protein
MSSRGILTKVDFPHRGNDASGVTNSPPRAKNQIDDPEQKDEMDETNQIDEIAVIFMTLGCPA